VSPKRSGKGEAFENSIELVDWSLKEDIDGNRYLVGTRPGRAGHVSKPLAEFYPDIYFGCTQSGTIYGLIGPPGRSIAGEDLWADFKSANGIKEVEK